jgi:hypothetical protein
MILRPRDLPTAQEILAKPDPALERICRWKDPQFEQTPNPDESKNSVAFVRKHGREIIKGAIEALLLPNTNEKPPS